MSLADLAFAASEARRAAQSAGGSLFGYAKQAAESMAYLDTFANTIRSRSGQGAAQAIGQLERSSPTMQRLLEMERRAAAGLSPAQALDMLSQLDAISRQGGNSQLLGIINEFRDAITDAMQAEELLGRGVTDESMMVRGQFPVGENEAMGFQSKQQEIAEEEGLIPIVTPGSSNVYSFWWIPDKAGDVRNRTNDNGTLFVCYKAWFKKQGGVTGAGDKRPNEPGSTYAYSNVNRKKYQEFAEHTSPNSAGWAVWEYLRVRGTHAAHQHPYRLTAGQRRDPSNKVAGGTYIPRKMTAQGLRTRTLVTSSGMQRSTLSPTMSRGSHKVFQPFGTPDAIRSHAQWRSIAAQRNKHYPRWMAHIGSAAT